MRGSTRSGGLHYRFCSHHSLDDSVTAADPIRAGGGRRKDVEAQEVPKNGDRNRHGMRCVCQSSITGGSGCDDLSGVRNVDALNCVGTVDDPMCRSCNNRGNGCNVIAMDYRQP